MTLRKYASDEFRRAPISTTLTAIGIVIATVSLLMAWLQQPATPSPAISAPGTQAFHTNLQNAFIPIAFFITATILSSFFIKKLAHTHDIAALFASVPIAALTNFLTVLLIYSSPTQEPSPSLFSSAHDLVLYASAAIYTSFFGMAVMRDIATPVQQANSEKTLKSDESSPDGLAAMVIAILLLAVWSSLVFSGQKKLTATFLPNITHYVSPDKTGVN
jgi:hypothetical protein